MKQPAAIFTEFGLDPKYNKYWLGISTEYEYSDSTEERFTGTRPLKINQIYIRLWMYKYVFILNSKNGLGFMKKNRATIKCVFGLGGVPK